MSSMTAYILTHYRHIVPTGMAQDRIQRAAGNLVAIVECQNTRKQVRMQWLTSEQHQQISQKSLVIFTVDVFRIM